MFCGNAVHVLPGLFTWVHGWFSWGSMIWVPKHFVCRCLYAILWRGDPLISSDSQKGLWPHLTHPIFKKNNHCSSLALWKHAWPHRDHSLTQHIQIQFTQIHIYSFFYTKSQKHANERIFFPLLFFSSNTPFHWSLALLCIMLESNNMLSSWLMHD